MHAATRTPRARPSTLAECWTLIEALDAELAAAMDEAAEAKRARHHAEEGIARIRQSLTATAHHWRGRAARLELNDDERSQATASTLRRCMLDALDIARPDHKRGTK